MGGGIHLLKVRVPMSVILNSNPNLNHRLNTTSNQLPSKYNKLDRFIEYNVPSDIARSLEEIKVLAYHTSDPYTDSWFGYILANWCGKLMLLSFELEPKAWAIDTFSVRKLNSKQSLMRALEVEDWSLFNGSLRDLIVEILKLWGSLETGDF